jgi:hypothetical protein
MTVLLSKPSCYSAKSSKGINVPFSAAKKIKIKL